MKWGYNPLILQDIQALYKFIDSQHRGACEVVQRCFYLVGGFNPFEKY